MQQLFQAPGFDVKMLVIYRSCVLYLWIQTLVLVKSQDCSLQDFISSPLFDSNANISSLEASYPNLKRLIVSCNEGSSGSIKLMCDEGEWMSNGIKCQVQQCPAIIVDDNVEVTGDPLASPVGSVLKFSCKSSLDVLNGPDDLYCAETKEWRADPPTCGAGIKCPAPVIEHGHITGEVRDYEENEVLHFECDQYYKKLSERPSMCLKLGNSAAFSPSPACVGGVCILPFSQISRYDPPHKNVFGTFETVTVSCDRTHYIKTPQTTSAVSTCDEDGNWDVTPECQEVRCSDRRIPHLTSLWHLGHGKHPGTYRIDDTVGYRCAPRYRATSDRATCTRDGWAPDLLCEALNN